MAMRMPGWVVVVMVLLSAVASAQSKPDFSGRWTSEAAAQEGRTVDGARPGARLGDMGSGWGSNIMITQDPNRLVIEYAFFARGDMQPPLRFVFSLDGAETQNSVMMGRGIQVQSSRASWDGASLHITTRHNFVHPVNGEQIDVEVKHTLSLESPDTLIVEATRGGILGGLASTTRTVYRKTP